MKNINLSQQLITAARPFRAMVKDVSESWGALDPDSSDVWVNGKMQTGRVKHGSKHFIVRRVQRHPLAPWLPWVIVKEIELPSGPAKPPVPPYVDGVIEAAKKLMLGQLKREDDRGQTWGHTITDLSKYLDAYGLFGWDDAHSWMVRVKGPFTEEQVKEYNLRGASRAQRADDITREKEATMYAYAAGAVRLAGFALRSLAKERLVELGHGATWYLKEEST